jgi:cell wall assembly regulator SMI1
MLGQALEHIFSWYKQHGRKVVALLQPGLTAQMITGRKATLVLDADVVHLYMWRNGTRFSQEYVLNDHYFTPGYYLLSLVDAPDVYLSRIANPDWQKCRFPILTSGGGDYYGVDHAQQGHVIHHIRDYPNHPVQYLSITAMMQTVAECYESGAYSFDDRGFFEVNADVERMIARLNPSLDYWQMD